MMKEEFVQILKDLRKTKKDIELSDEDYSVIEYVYAHHPLVETKEDAAKFYEQFGVSIFHSLVPSAQQFEAAYRKWQEANNHAEHQKMEWQIAQQEADALLDKYRAMTDALKIGANPGK